MSAKQDAFQSLKGPYTFSKMTMRKNRMNSL